MSPVFARYRNVINPWQTPREIKTQEKTVSKMLAWLKFSKEEEDKLLFLDKPDRVW